jgi:glycosyltransferase involved in cell wall biosynthesis
MQQSRPETIIRVSSDLLDTVRIAVLIPCYNEATTIERVIRGFRASLPKADIYVYDNNSQDGTAKVARRAGAIVRGERRQGKGYVVRRMFADIYLMVDGDAAYEASAAPRMVQELFAGPNDKVNGVRVHSAREAYRLGHEFGNKLFSRLVGTVFGRRCRDMLSGYKVFSRRFVKTFPAMSTGFEIETELLVHALDLDVPISEIDTIYQERPAGSLSKVSTFKEGIRILWLILQLIRDLLPLQFFSIVSAIFVTTSVALALPVIVNYLETGLVLRLPTAVLAVGMMLAGIIAFFTGLTLDSVAKGRREVKLCFLNHSSVSLSGDNLCQKVSALR